MPRLITKRAYGQTISVETGGFNLRHLRGFSLLEVLIAALFFSISLLGLLQYHQALLQGFASSWQQRQAWSWLHQYMESQSGTDPEERWAPEVKPGWHYRQFIDRIEGDCREFSVKLITRQDSPVELSRWFCSTEMI